MSEKMGVEERNGVLKDSLLKWLPEQSRLETAIHGLPLSRYDEEVFATRCFYYPMVALVVQGFKRSMIASCGIPRPKDFASHWHRYGSPQRLFCCLQCS